MYCCLALGLWRIEPRILGFRNHPTSVVLASALAGRHIRSLKDSATEVVLLYGNRSVKDILMRSAAAPLLPTLSELLARPALRTESGRRENKSWLALLVARSLSVWGF